MRRSRMFLSLVKAIVSLSMCILSPVSVGRSRKPALDNSVGRSQVAE